MKLINTYNVHIPKEMTKENQDGSICFTAVLTQDSCNQMAVYIGSGSDEWIMANGTKQSFEESKRFFPMLSEEDYRK